MKNYITLSEILTFLDTYGVIVMENETESYEQTMLDTHTIYTVAGIEYYVPDWHRDYDLTPKTGFILRHLQRYCYLKDRKINL